MEENTKKPSKVWNFIKNNKIVSLLLLVIIGLGTFIIILKINAIRTERTHISEIQQLTISNNEDLSEVFAWAVRGELLRDNMEGVNQLFSNFIKNDKVVKIQLVNSQTNKIILSTDKKDEGLNLEGQDLSNITNQLVRESDEGYSVYIPITGLNNTLGILVVEFFK